LLMITIICTSSSKANIRSGEKAEDPSMQMMSQNSLLNGGANGMLQAQNPILLNGGDLPPLNVFHNPIWVNQQQADPMSKLQSLNYLNKQLDEELKKVNVQQRIVIGAGDQSTNGIPLQNNYMIPQNVQYQQIPQSLLYQNNPQVMRRNGGYMLDPRFKQRTMQNQSNRELDNFPRINALENRFKETKLDFTGEKKSSPLCIRREGMLKIRDVDQKDKDVVVTYAVLTKDRLSYFVNAKDESSIQGSIDLAKIKESLKLINGFPTCFTIKTLDGVSDCSICAESEDSSREWINAITQNAVNCNTMSALNSHNKRGLLK